MQICARLVQDSCGEWYVTLKNNNLSENSFKVYILDGLFVSGQLYPHKMLLTELPLNMSFHTQ